MIDTRPSAPPLRLHVAFESRDLDEIRSIVRTAQHPIAVDASSSTRVLRFRMHHHPLSRVALTRCALTDVGQLQVRAPAIGTHYFLQLPHSGASDVTHGSQRVRTLPDRCGVLLSPECPTTWRSRGGFEETTVAIDATALEEAWRTLTGETPPRPIAFQPTIRLDSEPGASIARLVRFLLAEIGRPASPLASDPVRRRLEEALLLTLLSAQPHSRSHRLTEQAGTGNASLVRRAEAWMEQHALEAPTPSNVAVALGVSLRTLQRAFARHRGTAPRDALRRLRLAHARHRILHASSEVSVTRVAVESGFAHLGRFSADYRLRYGETPSHTLRRVRGRGFRHVAKRVDGLRSAGHMGMDQIAAGACGLCDGGLAPE